MSKMTALRDRGSAMDGRGGGHDRAPGPARAARVKSLVEIGHIYDHEGITPWTGWAEALIVASSVLGVNRAARHFPRALPQIED